MLRAVLVGSFIVIVAFAGCMSDGKKESVPEKVEDTVNKFVGEVPASYVSDGQRLAVDYASPDFPRVVEILTGGYGAEPNMGVTSKGSIFVTAFDQTLRSTDGGKTWKVVYDFKSANPAGPDAFDTSDPMLWVDPITDRIFTNHMFPVLTCSSQIYSDDDGETWTHVPMSCGIPIVDHQKLATAPPHAPLVMSPLYENVVYYCYNKLAGTFCSVSLDGGNHFEYETLAAGPADCGGINGHPHGAPDGTMYVPLGLNCGVPHVAVSEDNGLSWTVRQIAPTIGAAGAMLDIDPEITVTPDGTAYYYTRGADGNGYLVRSKDKFATFDGPFKVNPPDVKGVIFAAMASGDDGRVAIAYLGSRTWSKDPSEAAPKTRWHLYVSNAYNASAEEVAFQTHQVTPESDPVQIGCIWLYGGGNPCRNMLDFIDGFVDKEGRFYVAFTDGCTEAMRCAGNPKAGPDESRDRAVAVAVQDHGPSLFAAKGLLPSLGYVSQVNKAGEPT